MVSLCLMWLMNLNTIHPVKCLLYTQRQWEKVTNEFFKSLVQTLNFLKPAYSALKYEEIMDPCLLISLIFYT